jgi:mono/diheme cytochrome c family protein
MPQIAVFAATLLALCSAWPIASKADETGRPPAESLPVPLGATREQVVLGDRIFHGEAAGGTCSACHGWDAKGTATGNDLTSGLFLWGDSMKMIKATIVNTIVIAPDRDGDLTPADVDAVVAYVWAISHQKN